MPSTRTTFGTVCLKNGVTALERLVDTANVRQADFIVIAGDLFDKQSVTKKLIDRTVSVLADLEGEHVLVLAGNHDYFEGGDNKLWNWFAAYGVRSKFVHDGHATEDAIKFASTWLSKTVPVRLDCLAGEESCRS